MAGRDCGSAGRGQYRVAARLSLLLLGRRQRGRRIQRRVAPGQLERLVGELGSLLTGGRLITQRERQQRLLQELGARQIGRRPRPS